MVSGAVLGSVGSVAVGRRSSVYATGAANVGVLHESLEFLSVSRYQLAYLLDIKPKSYVYELWSGRRRPGNLLLIRLLRLYHLQGEGVLVYKMKSIDWNTGIVTWRDGRTSRLSSIAPAVIARPGLDDGDPGGLPGGQDCALLRSAAYRPKGDRGPVY